jgi:hypothetical protein
MRWYLLIAYSVIAGCGLYCDRKARKNLSQEGIDIGGEMRSWALIMKPSYFTPRGLRFRNIARLISLIAVMLMVTIWFVTGSLLPLD